MYERIGYERHEYEIEDELRMLRLQFDIAREGGYEKMVRRYRKYIEEVERELAEARRRR